VVGRKAFPSWGSVGAERRRPTSITRLAGVSCLAFAGAGAALPAAATEGQPRWCLDGPATMALTTLPARADAPKFALAEAACGPLKVAGPQAAPRVAAQLALYSDPPRGQPTGQSLDADVQPLPEVAAPPRTASKPRRAAPASGAAVQRIRALVPVVADAAKRHGIDPLLLHAVAHVESRHQAAARSHAGARGVMQVMPGTARRFGLDDPLRELLQPELNVSVGAEYLKTLQRRFGNNLPLVLAAYNAGEGAVEKYGRRIPPYPETQAYVRDVLATYAELRRRLGAPTGVAGSV
jgi:soluble lytic murein transglycosylase-like protein